MNRPMDPFDDELAKAARALPPDPMRSSKCLAVEALADFYSGRLGASASDEARSHLAGCPDCLAAASDARHFVEAMHGLEAERSGHRQRWWLAAAAVAGLAVGLVAYRAAGPAGRGAEDRWEDLVITKAPYAPGDVGEGVLWRGEADAFASGMKAYASSDFQTAALLLEQRLAQEPEHLQARFYLGVTLLMLDRPNEALPHLDRVQDADVDPWRQEARWYLALAQLKTGRRNIAARLLGAISSTPSNPHQQESSELLRRLHAEPSEP